MTTPILRGTLTPVAADVPAAPLLVLGPSLGTTSALWETAAAALSTRFRVLRFDLPGHGLSAPAAESFDLTDLAAAVVSLVDSVGGGRFSYAGVSIGGAIGIELALSPRGGVSMRWRSSAPTLSSAVPTAGWIVRQRSARRAPRPW